MRGLTMNTELVPVRHDALPAVAPVDVPATFLAGRNPRTLRAYAADLEDFARFAGAPSAAAAVESLLSLGQGQANAAVMAYRADLVGRGLTPNTVCHRLAALRSVVRCARLVGRVGWTLDVE